MVSILPSSQAVSILTDTNSEIQRQKSNTRNFDIVISAEFGITHRVKQTERLSFNSTKRPRYLIVSITYFVDIFPFQKHSQCWFNTVMHVVLFSPVYTDSILAPNHTKSISRIRIYTFFENDKGKRFRS